MSVQEEKGDEHPLQGRCNAQTFTFCTPRLVQEKLLVETIRWELLACVGAWGSLFAGAQVGGGGWGAPPGMCTVRYYWMVSLTSYITMRCVRDVTPC
jgi:hypothetical protein